MVSYNRIKHPFNQVQNENVSTKVVKIIQSYVGIVNKVVGRKVMPPGIKNNMYGN